MNIILIFLGICMILGLWIKPRARSGLVVVTILAFLLVIVFWLYSSLL